MDLDLSVALYDGSWAFLGKCDFTNLRFATTGAVHSGDLTSAPAPLGASEFIDIDVETLRQRGVRYVVMTVLSFNGVPFENMAEAFAGYMLRASADGPVFEARAVEQRFDLRGTQQVSVPLALDLGLEGAPTMCWLDTTPKARGLGEVVGHQVSGYEEVLGLSARRVLDPPGAGGLWRRGAPHPLGRGGPARGSPERDCLHSARGRTPLGLPEGRAFASSVSFPVDGASDAGWRASDPFDRSGLGFFPLPRAAHAAGQSGRRPARHRARGTRR